jgi:hypothetical protein
VKLSINLSIYNSFIFYVAVMNFLINDVGKAYFVTYYLSLKGVPTFGEVTSNMAESANNWLGIDLRSVGPVHCVYLYFLHLMRSRQSKRELKVHNGPFVHKAQAALEANLKQSRSYIVVESNIQGPDTLYKVMYCTFNEAIPNVYSDVSIDKQVVHI